MHFQSIDEDYCRGELDPNQAGIHAGRNMLRSAADADGIALAHKRKKAERDAYRRGSAKWHVLDRELSDLYAQWSSKKVQNDSMSPLQLLAVALAAQNPTYLKSRGRVQVTVGSLGRRFVALPKN